MNSETKKIFKTKAEVERLLVKYPHLKDNDERLVATFWKIQLKHHGYDMENMNAMDFLFIYSGGEILTSADLIVRARAKAQQDNPELRGELWKDRHKTGIEVTHEINK